MLFTQKTISKNLFQNLPLVLMLLLVMNGCNYFGKKPIKSTDTYCDKHFPLKKSEAIRKDVLTVSPETFDYFKINETTFQCDCPALKPEAEKQQCWTDFLNLNKPKK